MSLQTPYTAAPGVHSFDIRYGSLDYKIAAAVNPAGLYLAQCAWVAGRGHRCWSRRDGDLAGWGRCWAGFPGPSADYRPAQGGANFFSVDAFRRAFWKAVAVSMPRAIATCK